MKYFIVVVFDTIGEFDVKYALAAESEESALESVGKLLKTERWPEHDMVITAEEIEFTFFPVRVLYGA